jgi:hypothetical protein
MIHSITGSREAESENISGIPDQLLLQAGTIAVLTIRDPRIAVPSAFRVLRDMGLPHGSGRPNFTISTSPLWIRDLYNYFCANGIECIVIDADDVIADPDLVKDLCTKLDLNPAQLQRSWAKPTSEERARMHPSFYASQRVLIESEGIRPDLAKCNRDLDSEAKGWRADFGEDAEMVEEMIELALPHYKWLQERAFGNRLDQSKA